MMCGGSPALRPARPPAAAIQPAWRPMTSSTNTLVEVRAIEATSSAASRVETATYLATEPNPGQQSVCGRSLSTVLGTPIQMIGIAQRFGQLRHLQRGVHGIIAAVIEEVADVVGPEHLDETLVFGAVLLQALEFETGRTEGARTGVCLSPRMVWRLSLLTSMRSSVSAPMMPWRPA